MYQRSDLASLQVLTQSLPVLLLCLHSGLILNFQDLFILNTPDFPLIANGMTLACGIQISDLKSGILIPLLTCSQILEKSPTVHSCFNLITQMIAHTFLSKNKPGCIRIKNTEHYIINNRMLRTIN